MLHELTFPSSNGRDQVTGWIYVPATEPEGIVQLVHGFGEHSRRYFHMIVALMATLLLPTIMLATAQPQSPTTPGATGAMQVLTP